MELSYIFSNGRTKIYNLCGKEISGLSFIQSFYKSISEDNKLSSLFKKNCA